MRKGNPPNMLRRLKSGRRDAVLRRLPFAGTTGERPFQQPAEERFCTLRRSGNYEWEASCVQNDDGANPVLVHDGGSR